MLLSIAAATLACALAGSIRASGFVQYLLMSAAGVLCLLAQKWWFAPAFKGVAGDPASGNRPALCSVLFYHRHLMPSSAVPPILSCSRW